MTNRRFLTNDVCLASTLFTLGLLSTTVMVRLGRVEGNQMKNLVPASRKLERRALRILCALGEIDEAKALDLLRECHGSVQDALARLRGER